MGNCQRVSDWDQQTVFIEQAIFTSAQTSRGDGYHLVARSHGVSEEDAQQLAVWGPSHGALRDDRDEASSINFNRLTSGTLCVSKTVAAGAGIQRTWRVANLHTVLDGAR